MENKYNSMNEGKELKKIIEKNFKNNNKKYLSKKEMNKEVNNLRQNIINYNTTKKQTYYNQINNMILTKILVNKFYKTEHLN